EIRPGAELVMEMLGIDETLEQVDLVVTGEGRLDRQSTFGKGPVALARVAERRGVPVLVVAGEVDGTVPQSVPFTHVRSLVRAVGRDAALRDTAAALTGTTAAAIRDVCDA